MDSLLHVLMPDELREEYNFYGDQDYLTPYREVWEAYDRNRQIFVPMQEPALLDGNAARLTIEKPNSVEVFRIANDTLHIKKMNGSWNLPGFHWWSAIFESSPDSGVETQKIAITKADFDTILGMVKMIDTLTCRYEVKESEHITYFIEYNIEGRCHSSKEIFNLLGTDMKPVYNLVSFLEKKKRR